MGTIDGLVYSQWVFVRTVHLSVVHDLGIFNSSGSFHGLWDLIQFVIALMEAKSRNSALDLKHFKFQLNTYFLVVTNLSLFFLKQKKRRGKLQSANVGVRLTYLKCLTSGWDFLFKSKRIEHKACLHHQKNKLENTFKLLCGVTHWVVRCTTSFNISNLQHSLFS